MAFFVVCIRKCASIF